MPIMSYKGGCGGPDKTFSDKQGEEAFVKVMELLRKEYHIVGPENAPKFGTFKKHYEKAASNLKRALKDILWEDNCSTW